MGFWGNSCWHEAAPWGPISQANCTPCGTAIYPRLIQTISRYHLDPSKNENSKRIIQHSCTLNVKKHTVILITPTMLTNLVPTDSTSIGISYSSMALALQGEYKRTKHQVRFVQTTSNPQCPNRSCRVLISFCLPRHSRGPCGLGSLGWHASGLGSWPAVHTKVIIQMWLCQLVDTTQRKNMTRRIIWHWPISK